MMFYFTTGGGKSIEIFYTAPEKIRLQSIGKAAIMVEDDFPTGGYVRQFRKENTMSFFDDLTQKAKAVATTAGEMAKDAADSAKISAAILAERREMDKNYRAIGQWYVCEHGDEVPDAVADLVAAVKASQEKIAQLQASREKAMADEQAQEGVPCPVCGKISDAKFCPYCGAPMGQ